MAGRTLNRQSLWEIINPVFATGHPGDDKKTEQAIAIVLAESGGKTDARNHNTDGSIDRGIFQINNKAHPEVSDACADNPACASRAAYKISNGGTNWHPWSTFNQGKAKVDGSSSIPDAAVKDPIADAASGAGDAVASTGDALKTIGTFLASLGQAATWLHVIEVLGGVILLIMGLRVLTGNSAIPPMPKVVPIPI